MADRRKIVQVQLARVESLHINGKWQKNESALKMVAVDEDGTLWESDYNGQNWMGWKEVPGPTKA